jgi:Peptidase A4 family
MPGGILRRTVHRFIRAAAIAAVPLTLVPPPPQVPVTTRAGPTPYFVSHGRRVPAPAPATSTNWSGYAATGSTYTSVATTFTVPAVKCSSGDQYSSFWVGLDGYSSDSVEQTGIEADCAGPIAQYSAWYELYPAFPVTYSNVVKPGDVITESVAFSGSRTYTMTIKDTTRNWTKATAKDSTGNPRSSAEIIAEAPCSSGVLPLTDFGRVVFTGGAIDGGPLSSAGAAGITMTNPAGRLQAQVGPLSGGVFTDTWKSR